MDFIPRVTPRWEAPLPFRPYIDWLERAIQDPLQAVFAAPPQHGKTEATLHAFIWWMLTRPGLQHAYATYSQERAKRVSDKARLIAQRAGLDPQGSKTHWFAEGGSSILWTSVGGPFTGEGVSGVLVIDDPIKDRKQADSATYRQTLIDWFDDVAEPRCHKGASKLVMATRWHPGDLSGELIARDWPYLNLKAIADDQRPPGDERIAGEPLWEARQTIDALKKKRATNIFSFASLYQGEPRPRGGALFNEPHYYSELPTSAYRVAYGVDLAYTSKTSADFSVCVEIWKHVEHIGDAKSVRFYVVGVDRKQVDAPSFTLTLKARHSERRGGFWWYATGPEVGSANFIQQRNIPLTVMTPKSDKFGRAQECAEAWNGGRILVPEGDLPWVDIFVDEVCSFTGVNDTKDDQVDALVAGYDALNFDDDLGLITGASRYSR